MATLRCKRQFLGATILNNKGTPASRLSSNLRTYSLGQASQFNFRRAQFKATNVFGQNTDVPPPCSPACILTRTR